LQALTSWVMHDVPPPPSVIPTILAGTLVTPKEVKFPVIPANSYGGVARPAMKFTGLTNPLPVMDLGKDFNAAKITGIAMADLPKLSTEQYAVLVPQVDADGNDIGGIRSTALKVPIGTYTGWNLFRAGLFEDGFCTLQGSFVPFAATKAERTAIGDPRPSIEERYATNADYVTMVRRAADSLVKERLLLPDDAKYLIDEARSSGIGARN
jgi:hypothetical protein